MKRSVQRMAPEAMSVVLRTTCIAEMKGCGPFQFLKAKREDACAIHRRCKEDGSNALSVQRRFKRSVQAPKRTGLSIHVVRCKDGTPYRFAIPMV